ncbi:MAG: type III pantothenate kinase [Candidatus Cloacimonadota bacterium]|nr:type III pantothenate kinase [Candidatus Cloacimonadota bacterium]
MKNINMVVDIGNTHIVMGFYSNTEFLYSWRLNTDKAKTEDEYFAIIKQLADERKLLLPQVKKVAISSVVPELTRIFSHLINKYLKCDVEIVNAYSELGLEFPIEDPGFVGSDLVVNAFSAISKYKTNCIICDFGTATTIQLVGKDGLFFGTIIAPGVITSAKNLFDSTALLSNIQLKKPKHLLGTNTTDALLSGIITGNSFMLDGFIKALKKEYKHFSSIKTIATGGIAELICSNSKEIDIIDKNLTLNGLNLICCK